MSASVIGKAGQCRLTGWADEEVANRFLDHLAGRAFAMATVRAYAYDVLCFARFCPQHRAPPVRSPTGPNELTYKYKFMHLNVYAR